jgi:hypothetical protein
VSPLNARSTTMMFARMERFACEDLLEDHISRLQLAVIRIERTFRVLTPPAQEDKKQKGAGIASGRRPSPVKPSPPWRRGTVVVLLVATANEEVLAHASGYDHPRETSTASISLCTPATRWQE